MEERISGISLGTTNSSCFIYKCNKLTFVPFNPRCEGDPSWFYYNGKYEMYGYAAEDKFFTEPEFCMYNSKKLIGKTYKEVKDDLRLFKITNVVERIGKPVYEIKDNEGKFIKTFTPENVHEKIIKHLKKELDNFNGSEITKAVICVPATFDDNQREATMKTALFDSENPSSTNVFKGVKLIKEPIAAALAYIENGSNISLPNNSKILVYDFGGTTFDLSLLEYNNGYFTVKATDSNPHLGGDDITNAIVKEFAPKFKIDLKSDDIKILKRKRKLLKSCENAKKLFADISQTSVTIECGDDEKELSYAIFYKISDPFINETIKMTKEFLKKNQIKSYELSKVIATGGSSMLRNVKEKLIHEFYEEDVYISSEPFYDAAKGAAIYGHKFLQRKTIAPIGIDATRNKKCSFVEIIPAGTEWGRTITVTGANDKNAEDALFEFYEYDVSEENYLGELVLPFNDEDKNKKINSLQITLKVRINSCGELEVTASYEGGIEKSVTIHLFKTKEDFE